MIKLDGAFRPIRGHARAEDRNDYARSNRILATPGPLERSHHHAVGYYVGKEKALPPYLPWKLEITIEWQRMVVKKQRRLEVPLGVGRVTILAQPPTTSSRIPRATSTNNEGVTRG